MQTSGSVFADRIGQIKKTKFELEVMRILDCFLYRNGKYANNLVLSKKNLCKLTFF